MATRVGGRRAIDFRAEMKAIWQPINAACGICGQNDIDWDGLRNQPNSFELDHRIPTRDRPDLEFDRANCQPSHCRCNRSRGAGDAIMGAGETSEPW